MTSAHADGSRQETAEEVPRQHHDAPAVEELIGAVRRYRTAESRMRARSSRSMRLNWTDMTALRLMLRASRAGTPVNAAALGRDLQISSAATTVLIDRLENRGHAERRRSAADARSVEIWPTPAAHDAIRATMGDLHERMMAVARSLTPAEAQAVRTFYAQLEKAMDEMDFPPPPGPDVP